MIIWNFEIGLAQPEVRERVLKIVIRVISDVKVRDECLYPRCYIWGISETKRILQDLLGDPDDLLVRDLLPTTPEAGQAMLDWDYNNSYPLVSEADLMEIELAGIPRSKIYREFEPPLRWPREQYPGYSSSDHFQGKFRLRRLEGSHELYEEIPETQPDCCCKSCFPTGSVWSYN